MTVTIKVVSSGYPNGLELGTATVDASGNWSLRTLGTETLEVELDQLEIS